MFKSITANAITAITTAAIAATLTILLTPGVVPEAKAQQVVGTLLPAPAPALADSLPEVAKGNACSSRGWPHFEQGCLFDLRTPASEWRTVRIIVLP